MPDDPDHIPLDEEGFQPADAPPAWGTESRDERLGRLLRSARGLPPAPGVYLMKDHKGVVLYVGKAASLPDRVASYFVPSADLGPKKGRMLDEVHSFDYLLTETEWEALLTENRLIKDIRPRHNERLVDDKSFPYLVVTRNEDFPRVFVTRNPAGIDERTGEQYPEMRNARVFGPFANAGALREAVQTLQRVFKYRTCKLDIVAGDPKNRYFRPCLLHAIGQCTAPCNESVSVRVYGQDIDRFVKFLGTKRSVMLREMRAEMEEASEKLEFERAAALRDQIVAIEKLSERGHRSDRWQPETEIGYTDPIKGTQALQKALGMDRAIRCVEGFDIAHLQGGETVGSKVCFIDGKPFKDEYRRYRIKSFSNLPGGRANDDYTALAEVVSRRYREAGAGHELYPDVILIDGGLGQLHAALEAFETLDVQPPMVISIAKKEELVYVQREKEPIRLSRNNAGLRLLQQVRDEAHRFAQHYHHILRRKKTLGEEK
ncbi:MAG: excinuclease ABC subunit UvrC [Phycisphaerales bacterium]|nr:excinuclease ABC subunit UvrC [Phycisphaerales bacterium]